MSPWLLACLVACWVGAWAPTVHAQGGFEDCCLRYHTNIKWAILRRARHYRCQEVSGSCNLWAVIFHLPHKDKMLCLNPRDREVQRAMWILTSRNESDHNTQKTFQDCWAWRKRLISGKFQSKDPSSSRRSKSYASLNHSRVVRTTKGLNHPKLHRKASGM